jgi:hypothetical protein
VLSKDWEKVFLLSKLREILKFLKRISRRNPKENSKPANAKIKNALLIKFISSFKEDTNKVKQ